jgi:hypothetical protein
MNSEGESLYMDFTRYPSVVLRTGILVVCDIRDTRLFDS